MPIGRSLQDPFVYADVLYASLCCACVQVLSAFQDGGEEGVLPAWCLVINPLFNRLHTLALSSRWLLPSASLS